MSGSAVHANLARLESGASISASEARVFALLREAGLAHSPPVVARVAGGWVRDKLLGLPASDIDVTVENARGVDFARYLESRHGARVRCNPAQSEQLASAKVCLWGGLWVDVCGLRCEEYCAGSRIPRARAGSAREDALRRDFTVNSLFFNVATSRVEDFAGGLADLAAGRLRTPGDPAASFADDPLRVLRACRFAARFALAVDAAVVAAARASVAALAAKVARPRMEREVCAGLAACPAQCVRYYAECGVFAHIFDPAGAWGLEGEAAARRVECAARRATDAGDRYGVALAAVYAPLWGREPVPDPAGKRRIHPVECAIVRQLCAPAAVAQLALRLLRSAAAVRAVAVTRAGVGLWLRDTGPVWRQTQCLLFEEEDFRFFSEGIVPYVEAERLEGVWDLQPLLSGADLARLHSVPPGPAVTGLLAELIAWQIEHPAGTAQDYERFLAEGARPRESP
jgi:tRNA nucleotidyltransferase (CCA-adding enzyme)